MKALSIKQPWAWAIMEAGKDIENRDWRLPKQMLGQTVAIHASKGMTKADYQSFVLCVCDMYLNDSDNEIRLIPEFSELTRGAIVGTVEITKCVKHSESPWFFGEFGFVLRNPRLLVEPIPFNGALGFWEVPKEIKNQFRFKGEVYA